MHSKVYKSSDHNGQLKPEMAATLKRRAPLPATDLHSYDAIAPCDVIGRIQESVTAVTTVLNAAADPAGSSQLWASQSLYRGRIEELLTRWLEGAGMDWERWLEDGARQVKMTGKVICGRVIESAVDAMQDKVEEMASVFQQLVAMGEWPKPARWSSGIHADCVRAGAGWARQCG
jgi:hypothetical protein